MKISLEQPTMNQTTTEKVFKALPEGLYPCKVIDCTLGNSQNGRPMLIMEYQLEGDKSFEGAMLNNRKEKQRIMLDSSFVGKQLNGLLFSLGFNTKNMSEVNIEEMVNSQALVGRSCLVNLVKTSYISKKTGQSVECNEVKYTKKKVVNDDLPF